MEIKDLSGKYEVKVDSRRGVVYQKNIGLWTEADMERFHNDVVKKVIPLLKGKKWTAISDSREYKTSPIAESMASHIDYCEKNGMVGGAVIVDSAIVKMQINRAAKGSGLSPMAFTSLDEAEEWLKSKGI